MSHFAVVVIIEPEETAIEEAVEKALAPYDENGEWFREGSRWDSWVIGGRWDGKLLGLEPVVEYVVCDLCLGTGTRADGLAQFGPEWVKMTKGCNGCKGTGKRETYPNQYRTDLGRNVAWLREIRNDFVPLAFVTPDGQWYERGRIGWFGIFFHDEQGREAEDKRLWAQKWTEARGVFANYRAVLVDCHV